jgi:NAD(P)H-dependent FMN reductase
MKKVLVISTSPRKDGNSEILCDEFIKGAIDNGNSVEKISLHDKQIGFCIGCLSCQTTKKCTVQDDANQIVDKMLLADAIVFATPIYFNEMCGQMKTLLDRSNPLFPSDYNFRNIYLLLTAADNDPACMDNAINGLQGWIECYKKSKLCGVVRGIDIFETGAVRNFPTILQESYKMGNAV